MGDEDTMPSGSPVLLIESLSKTYRGSGGRPDVPALDNVTIEVGAGEFVAIVGPSGCGKSTLFNIASGLIQPSGGHVHFGGRQDGDLLGEIGYMFQHDLLMPWRTVLDNTTLGLELNGVSKHEARKQALAEFERFGLSGFEKDWPAKLSGGMRQRAAMLRTFLAGRELMLLDEPFGALDSLTRQQMQQWLLQIWQGDRKTILFVTHDVEEAVLLSDRVYAMTGRPGGVAQCVEVTLPRPRHRSLVTSPEFLELKERIQTPMVSA